MPRGVTAAAPAARCHAHEARRRLWHVYLIPWELEWPVAQGSWSGQWPKVGHAFIWVGAAVLCLWLDHERVISVSFVF